MTEQTTTIRVSVKTRDELIELGKKNESYDDVIRMLLKSHGEKEG